MPTAEAVATERLRLLSINISCPRGAQQQTRWRPLLLSMDGKERRTDRRTLKPFIDPAPHMRTESIKRHGPKTDPEG